MLRYWVLNIVVLVNKNRYKFFIPCGGINFFNDFHF